MQNFGSSVQGVGFLTPAELPVSMASSRLPGTFLMTGCRISSCPFHGSKLESTIDSVAKDHVYSRHLCH